MLLTRSTEPCHCLDQQCPEDVQLCPGDVDLYDSISIARHNSKNGHRTFDDVEADLID